MWLFTVLCVLLPSLAAAEIYKYPDGQGGVVFKSEPCEWQCEEPTPAPAPKPAPTTKQSRPPIQPAQVPPEESSPASSRVSPPSESSPPPSGPSSLAQKQQEMRGLILPIQPTEATCTQLGQSAETFAILRDRGTPARDLISQFTAAATKTPGAVWEFWESVMRSIILHIYANTGWTPVVARQRIELACLAERRAAPSMERGQLTDWEGICKAQGEAAYVIVQARDRGIAYTALLNVVRDSYRQGPAELAPVMDQWFATVGLALYEQRGLQPETARQQVEVGCLKARQKNE